MVRNAFLVFAALAALLIACSGGGDSSPQTQQAESTARPTRESTGPTASVEPRSGPPGSEITVSGASWSPGITIDVTGRLSAGVSADPFATTTTDQDGNFSVTFRLEKTPDGNDLDVGGYTLIVRHENTQVGVPFLVETRRPVQDGGPSG